MLRKILISIACVTATVAAVAGPVDLAGRDAAEQAFRRALLTFAIARTLNGVISVAQGTEVAVEPAGVGVNFAPGEILDPINDLVERFSSVMLVATSALGAQNVLLRVSAWWGVTALLGLATIIYIVTAWRWPDSSWYRVAERFVLVIIAARFAIPMVMIGTGLLFDTFLEAEHAAATAALSATSEEIRAMNDDNPTAELPDSVFGRIGAFIDDSIDNANVAEKLERFRQGLANASEHIINLIVVFVLQTIVIPIALLWLLGYALRRLV